MTMTANKNRANTMDPVIAYTNMLLYSMFLLLLINPALVMTDSRRAADVKAPKETTTLTQNAKSPQNSQQSNQDSNNQGKHPTISTNTSSDHVNCSLPKYKTNLTLCKDNGDKSFIEKMYSNSGMLFRTMYVLLAVTGVVIIYFVIKLIRVKRRRSKSRKYGIITKQGDHGDMEMEPLGDGADEDDDYTVFEMSRRK